MSSVLVGTIVPVPTTAGSPAYAPVSVDVTGSLLVNETYAARAEDNTNSVFAIAYKPVAASTYAPSRTGSFAAQMSGTVKASPGNLLAVEVINQNTSVDLYFQVHNLAATPAAATVPVFYWPIPPKTANNPGTLVRGMDVLTQAGVHCTTGIAVSVSTASGSNVAPTTAQSLGVSWFVGYV